MDWRQLWEICSAPDNVPIVGLIPLLAFYIYLAVKQARGQRPIDRATRSRSGDGEDAPSQDLALQARLGEGSARLAISAAH